MKNLAEGIRKKELLKASKNYIEKSSSLPAVKKGNQEEAVQMRALIGHGWKSRQRCWMEKVWTFKYSWSVPQWIALAWRTWWSWSEQVSTSLGFHLSEFRSLYTSSNVRLPTSFSDWTEKRISCIRFKTYAGCFRFEAKTANWPILGKRLLGVLHHRKLKVPCKTSPCQKIMIHLTVLHDISNALLIDGHLFIRCIESWSIVDWWWCAVR